MCLNGLTVQWPVMSRVRFEPSCADRESNRFQEGGGKESLLESVGFSSKMRLIAAKTIGECSCFKNKRCEHDCLQNRNDTNLFLF